MKTKKISGFLAVLCIFAVMLPSTIFAAEASQEGLRATLTTGQSPTHRQKTFRPHLL